MNYAQVAAECINAWCAAKWPTDNPPNKMASTWANGSFIDAFDHIGSGSHKYIPADKLTADLGEPEGAGVYGYWKMRDESYLLRTCKGPLAHWSGKSEEPAIWG